jgi:hypothetical protein
MKQKRQYKIARMAHGPWEPIIRDGKQVGARQRRIWTSTATRDYRRAVRIVYWLRKRLKDEMVFAGG